MSESKLPMNSNDLVGESRVCMEAGNFDRAIELLTAAIATAAPNAEVYFLRGLCRLEIESLGPAVEDFNQALDIDADLHDAYFYRGFAHEKTGDFQQAVSDYTQALHRCPSYADAFINRQRTK